MDIKLVGCVILYNPDNSVIGNIKTYIDYVDKLYIIDNCNGNNIFKILLKDYRGKVEYIKNNENMGIAQPLNQVLRLSENDYTFLLTMDQDSYFKNKSAENYRYIVNDFNWNETLGLSPIILDKNNKIIKDINSYVVITSGNLVNIKNAIKIGLYDENLFIDEVDHEFCYRGYINGYKSHKLNISNDIFLKHNLGNPKIIKIFTKNYQIMNYNYVRTYYIIRNKLYVYFKYHSLNERNFYYNYIYVIFRLVVSKIFFEDDKIRKIKSIYLGVKDYVNKNMGKKEFNY